jgi:hypothetical protein
MGKAMAKEEMGACERNKGCAPFMGCKNPGSLYCAAGFAISPHKSRHYARMGENKLLIISRKNRARSPY